jgi:hypothetical protein
MKYLTGSVLAACMEQVIVAVIAPLICAVHADWAASDDPASTGPVDEDDEEELPPHASVVATSPAAQTTNTVTPRPRLIPKPYQNEMIALSASCR